MNSSTCGARPTVYYANRSGAQGLIRPDVGRPWLLRRARNSRWTHGGDSATVSHVKKLIGCVAFSLVAAMWTLPLSGQSDKLILFGDVVYFYPPGNARNCILNNDLPSSRFKTIDEARLRLFPNYSELYQQLLGFL